jgi:hypothetical protein
LLIGPSPSFHDRLVAVANSSICDSVIAAGSAGGSKFGKATLGNWTNCLR